MHAYRVEVFEQGNKDLLVDVFAILLLILFELIQEGLQNFALFGGQMLFF